MLRSTPALSADHSARSITAASSPAPASTALRRLASAVAATVLPGPADSRGTGPSPLDGLRHGRRDDLRDNQLTHRIWRAAAVGGGPGTR